MAHPHARTLTTTVPGLGCRFRMRPPLQPRDIDGAGVLLRAANLAAATGAGRLHRDDTRNSMLEDGAQRKGSREIGSIQFATPQADPARRSPMSGAGHLGEKAWPMDRTRRCLWGCQRPKLLKTEQILLTTCAMRNIRRTDRISHTMPKHPSREDSALREARHQGTAAYLFVNGTGAHTRWLEGSGKPIGLD